MNTTDLLYVEKPRKANFSNDEKVVLMQCVAKYKNIVECKKTNGTTWKEKSVVWDKISLLFNSQSPAGIHRTKESLKKCYENKKADIRKLAASNRQQLQATGGGTYTPKTDPCLELVLDITNRKTVDGLEDEFGGDAQIHNIESEDGLPITNEIVLDDRHIDHNYCDNIGISLENSSTTSAVQNVPSSSSSSSSSQYIRRNMKKVNDISNFLSQRRRPKAVRPVHTNVLSQQYSEVATLKAKYLQKELEVSANKEAREVEEFTLRKRALELDIQIKELQLKKLKNSFDDIA